MTEICEEPKIMTYPGIRCMGGPHISYLSAMMI